ncbi:hypothetical protein Sjap_011947 [Stephania japonica]|uniref:Uncharacterized protein n=1 Tax=Stephania japonica TaxID=461633 RepID=A0AAP0JED2_9MAGN
MALIEKGLQHGKSTHANANKLEGMKDITMVNKEKGTFGLSDLFKEKSEVMGSGNLGSAYKAVMANGVAVMVKRITHMRRIGKKELKEEMRQLGTL